MLGDSKTGRKNNKILQEHLSLNTSRIYFKLPWSKWEWRAHVARAAPAARASGRLNVGYNFIFNVDYIALRAQRALRALRVRLAVLMSAITCLKLSGITLHAPCAQRARVSQNNFTSNFSFNVGLATQRAPRALSARGARSGTAPVELSAPLAFLMRRAAYSIAEQIPQSAPFQRKLCSSRF